MRLWLEEIMYIQAESIAVDALTQNVNLQKRTLPISMDYVL
jgi:hypothetical protein